MRKYLKKVMVSALALSVIMSNMSVSASAADAKYKVADSGNGYYVVTQKGGETLSYSKTSGVKLLEDDGFAFKDLNKNGKLDKYEDWRLDNKTRATDLANEMVADGRKGIEFIAGNMIYTMHESIKSEKVEDTTTMFASKPQTVKMLQDWNMRHLLISGISATKEVNAKWSNNVQALCEASPYGVPNDANSDPRSSSNKADVYTPGKQGATVSKWPSSLGLAATMDAKLVKKAGSILAQEYRALGITTGLGPQIDLATQPTWSRNNGTFGENSLLDTDLSRAYVDGFQTTAGSKTGWGLKSVNCMIKHWPSGGPEEGGRDGHYGYGKYAVYPGNNFEEQLKAFTEGAFKLDGATKSATAVMPYYTISYGIDKTNNENVGNAFSKYIITDLLRGKYNFDGVVCTDWMVTWDASNDSVFEGKCWGVEGLTSAERAYKAITAGCDAIGGAQDASANIGAYDLMVKEKGQSFADARFADSERRLLINAFNVKLFENPYLNPNTSKKILGHATFMKEGFAAQVKSVVMLKNKNNIIKKADSNAKKLTVYIPKIDTVSTDFSTGKTTTTQVDSFTVVAAEKYYNVTSDPKQADFALIGMDQPSTGGGYSTADLTAGGNGYVPVSLQYSKYTATAARKTSIASDPGKNFIDSATGKTKYTDKVKNRSYLGKSTVATNLSQLTALQATKKAMGTKPVIVYMRATNPVIWSEEDSLSDAILVGYGISDQAVMEIVAGKKEPSGLLPMQQPLNMDQVETQKEDVPQDMKCYVDEMGNTYDFGFGLNWSGKISDKRTAKYAAK